MHLLGHVYCVMDFSSAVMSDLHKYVSPKNKKPSPMISKQTYDIITEHANVRVWGGGGLYCWLWMILYVMLVPQTLNSAIIYDRDYGYSYFGFKTLERSYLLKIDGRSV